VRRQQLYTIVCYLYALRYTHFQVSVWIQSGWQQKSRSTTEKMGNEETTIHQVFLVFRNHVVEATIYRIEKQNRIT
jgi:hypothetical protein